MDMAVDTCGKIWLIEANAKPDKGINVEHVDIDGKPFIDLKQESKMKSDSNNKKGIEGFEVVLPQALATFKYAKFLVKCK
jgi:hypothetical protein